MYTSAEPLKFIDLFCGIGGFRYAITHTARKRALRFECVLSSDIDPHCQLAYEANFGERPLGDIKEVQENTVPDHDILVAGFPCQPFSIIGQMKGFEDTRGTLFFDIARIIKAKKPKAFVLENVKLLAGHNKGETLKVILKTLRDMEYTVDYRILNALNFGLPQKRERIWIVGFLEKTKMEWPTGGVPMIPLKDILEKKVDPKHFASDYIQNKRLKKASKSNAPTIWHENKSGNISTYPYSCALRAGASYNYLLVNGERRLTPREMLRLQGFPDDFKIICSDTQTRKQAGNSLPVSVAAAVLEEVFRALKWGQNSVQNTVDVQMAIFEKIQPESYYGFQKNT